MTRQPTILDAANRRVALGLAVNWGMRFVVAQSALLAGHEINDVGAREVVEAVVGP